MYVDWLELSNFRSYEHAELRLKPGVTVFVGANGQGKTNLVEAVEYLSTLSSHRVGNDAPLVRAGAEQAVIRADVQAGAHDTRHLWLEVELNLGRANRARINHAALPRNRDLIGALRTVLFSPEDLRIVKGDPVDRRTFIDTLLISRWPRLAGVKADYDRVLRQRNTLLKSIAGRQLHGAGFAGIDETLTIWDEQLANLGAELLASRLLTLDQLRPLVADWYMAIAPVNDYVSATYKTATQLSEPADQASLASVLLDQMSQRRSEEIARAVSLVGPHRDDIELGIGALPAKGYASHGESWSLALALRLGSFDLLRADGVEPVLILDDVFAELDASRRDRLGTAVRSAEQVLVTAAVEADLPKELDGPRFAVQPGQVGPTMES